MLCINCGQLMSCFAVQAANDCVLLTNWLVLFVKCFAVCATDEVFCIVCKMFYSVIKTFGTTSSNFKTLKYFVFSTMPCPHNRPSRTLTNTAAHIYLVRQGALPFYLPFIAIGPRLQRWIPRILLGMLLSALLPSGPPRPCHRHWR